MTHPRLRIGAIDDHPAVLSGVLAGLVHVPDAEVVAVAGTVDQFLALGRDVDIVLLDVVLNDGTDVADNVTRLRETGAPVLLYTQEHRPQPIARAFQAGAVGIVGKHEPLDVLATAITQVCHGEPVLNAQWASVVHGESLPDLAPREAEAVRLYGAGLPLKSVARRMSVSQETAKEYLIRARRKYAASGRPAHTKTDLYRRAVEDGYLDPP
jgi:DNA-binding NarL/FixJ family response regulator